MKRGNVLFLFALFPLVPASNTLANAIVLSVALVWFYLTGLLLRYLVERSDLQKAGPVAELTCLAGSAAVFLEVLSFISPLLALTLSFHVVLSAFAFLLLVSIDKFSAEDALSAPVLRFIPFYIAFSVIRELLAFGTISVPARNGTLFVTVLGSFESYRLGFWGTTGGALIMLGAVTWITKYVNRRISAYRRNCE